MTIKVDNYGEIIDSHGELVGYINYDPVIGDSVHEAYTVYGVKGINSNIRFPSKDVALNEVIKALKDEC